MTNKYLWLFYFLHLTKDINFSKETENVSSKIETPKSKNKIEKTPEKISVPKVPTDPENIFVFEICKREGIWKKVKLFTF